MVAKRVGVNLSTCIPFRDFILHISFGQFKKGETFEML